MKKISNRRVWHDYQIGAQLQAGIVLTGVEVRAIRCGRVSLTGAYIKFDANDQLWLINLIIRTQDTNPTQLTKTTAKRHKLLLTKAQLKKLRADCKQHQTIVVLDLILAKHIKVNLAPAKGRKKYDKRQLLKQRSTQRVIDRRLKRNF